ncbi:MAG: hypothetical protein IJN16_11505 [Lachnospiraceae bacterium]|nr:hypothetical protein [Lachnospiraceae bacterium]
MIKYEELNVDFLIGMFPEFEEEICHEVDWLGEFLPHCVFGNVLNYKVVELLKREDYLENVMLHRIFKMYEDFAVTGDEETQNLLQVTLLEYLWDEKITYERSLEIMGSSTKEIWDCIQEYILIPTE